MGGASQWRDAGLAALRGKPANLATNDARSLGGEVRLAREGGISPAAGQS